MSAFLTPLDVRLIDSQANDGRGEWEHLNDFSYQSDVAKCIITAKRGERTDFASVPRFPLIWLFAGDKGRKAAAIHDHLYRTMELDRELSDEVLKEALLVEGYTEDEADSFFFAVRIAGGPHYGIASPVATSALFSSAGGLDNSV
jgi:Protein of unknown function (DUF1353).